MRDYDELVKRLREHNGWALNKTLDEAADTIEELSAYAMQLKDLRKDGYYLQKTKMMTYGQATMTMPLPEPPKEKK